MPKIPDSLTGSITITTNPGVPTTKNGPKMYAVVAITGDDVSVASVHSDKQSADDAAAKLAEILDGLGVENLVTVKDAPFMSYGTLPAKPSTPTPTISTYIYPISSGNEAQSGLADEPC